MASVAFSRTKPPSSTSKNLAKEFSEPRNVEVFLRIRGRGDDEEVELVKYKLDCASICLQPPANTKLANTIQKFTFSHVLDQGCTQQEVFHNTALSLAKNLVANESGLLFNYGVSNSGKTFTMQGTPSDPGLVPRTLDMLFQLVGDKITADITYQPSKGLLMNAKRSELKKLSTTKTNLIKTSKSKMGNGNLTDILSRSTMMPMSSTMLDCTKNTTAVSDFTSPCLTDISIATNSESRSYTVWISFLEIYNDCVYDLFANMKAKHRVALIPCSNGDDDIFIRGLLEIPVSSADEAYRLFLAGQSNLHKAATKLNYNSSRSHCCFYVKLVSCDGNNVSQSVLTLCDLAGSERNSKTDSVGDRLVEANKINNSLFVLGRCMELLRWNPNSCVVPYRDCKLTHIFKSFFTGKGRVVSIVNIGLRADTFDETIHALKFSAVAREVIIPQAVESLKVVTNNNLQDILNLRRTLSNIGNCKTLSIPWEDEAMRPSSDFSIDSGDDSDSLDETSVVNCDYLIAIINCMKKLLVKAFKEKDAIEIEVRNELCDQHAAEIKHLRHFYTNKIEDVKQRYIDVENQRQDLIVGLHQEKKRELMHDHSSQIKELQMEKEEIVVEKEIALGELESLKEVLANTSAAASAIQQKYTKLWMEVADVQQQLQPMNTMKKRVSFAFGSLTPLKDIFGQSMSAANRLSLNSPTEEEPYGVCEDFGVVFKKFVKTNKENCRKLQLENRLLKQQLATAVADALSSQEATVELKSELLRLKEKLSSPMSGNSDRCCSIGNATMNATDYFSILNSGSGTSGSGSTSEGSAECPVQGRNAESVFSSPDNEGAVSSPAPVKSLTFSELSASGSIRLKSEVPATPSDEEQSDTRELSHEIEPERNEIVRLKDAVDALTIEKLQLSVEIHEQTTIIETLENKLKVLEDNEKVLAAKIGQLGDAANVLTGDKRELLQELTFARVELGRLAEKVDSEKFKMDDSTKMLHATAKQLESQVLKLTNQLSDKDLELISLVQQHKTLGFAFAKTEGQILENEKTVTDLQRIVKDQQVKIKSLNSRVNLLKEEHMVEKSGMQDVIANLEKVVFDANKRSEVDNETLSALKGDLQASHDQLASKMAELSGLHQKINSSQLEDSATGNVEKSSTAQSFDAEFAVPEPAKARSKRGKSRQKEIEKTTSPKIKSATSKTKSNKYQSPSEDETEPPSSIPVSTGKKRQLHSKQNDEVLVTSSPETVLSTRVTRSRRTRRVP